MRAKKMKKSSQKGTTLIELMIVISIFVLAALSVYSMVLAGFKLTKAAQARMVATYLANEQMEIIKNLPYDSVATAQGWVPPGPIPNTESVIKNGLSFIVETDVSYIDDPFDGLDGGAPPDSFPWDYKKVRVNVRWYNAPMINGPVTLVSNIVPKGLEGLSAGKGAIAVKVFDSAGVKIPFANMSIVNNSLIPAYSLNTTTDINGNLYLVNLEPSNEGYKITASKSGYSTEKTYSAADLTALGYASPTPDKPYASVFAGEITPESFQIDRVANLTLNSIRRSDATNAKINTDLGNDNQDNASFVLDASDNVYFVWRDDRGGSQKIYTQKYDDNWNKGWNPDPRLTSAGNADSTVARIGNIADFYTVWNDDRNGNKDIYIQRFSFVDAGEIWSGPKKVNTDSGAADQIEPNFFLDANDNSYIIFSDNREGDYDLFLQKYDANGSGVWLNDIKAHEDAALSNQRKPKIIFKNNYLYAVWLDNRGGGIDNVYAQKYDLDGNRIWANDLKVNTDAGAAGHYAPNLAVDASNNVYFAWADDRDGDKDIYMQKYDTAGNLLWGSGDVKLNADYDSAEDEPSLALDNANSWVYVSWTDSRNGNEDIYYNKYAFNNGAKLFTYDIKVNDDSTAAVQRNSRLALTSSGEIIIAWQDQRSGNWDIYAFKYSDPLYAAAGNINFTIWSNKTIGTYIDGGALPIYKYKKTKTIGVSGSLVLPEMSDPADELEWGSYSLSVSSPDVLIDSAPPLPISVEANSSKSAAIIIE